MGVVSTDHVDSAKAAGLRYVSDSMPGIKRLRHGRGFSYVGADGQVIQEKDAINRFRALVIPPAWTDVWICPHEDGHLQVTARDARGSKQYRYHPSFRAYRDVTKFERLFEFGEVIWKIRARVERDVLLEGLPDLGRHHDLRRVSARVRPRENDEGSRAQRHPRHRPNRKALGKYTHGVPEVLHSPYAHRGVFKGAGSSPKVPSNVAGAPKAW